MKKKKDDWKFMIIFTVVGVFAMVFAYFNHTCFTIFFSFILLILVLGEGVDDLRKALEEIAKRK